MTFATTDLCDAHGDSIRVVAPGFHDFGACRRFAGTIRTVCVYEDNVLVRATLEQAGHGQVLVVDGDASFRCALLGDQLATLAHQNGWEGVIINGAIRDAAAVVMVPLRLGLA